MINYKIKPDGNLNIVEYIRIHESDNQEGSYIQKFVPNPSLALVLHYNETMPEYSLDGKCFTRLPEMYFVFPYLTQKPVLFKINKDIKSIIFVFQASVFPSFFDIRIEDAIRIFIPASKVLSSEKYDQLFSSFLACSVTDERINCVLNFLESFKSGRTYKEEILKKAISIIHTNKGVIEIAVLAQLCSVSVRTLERYFKNSLYISPGQYKQVFRFNSILSYLMRPNYDFDLKSNCIFEHSLTDSSHLIKEFKSFCGETPNKYLQNLKLNYTFEKDFASR